MRRFLLSEGAEEEGRRVERTGGEGEPSSSVSLLPRGGGSCSLALLPVLGVPADPGFEPLLICFSSSCSCSCSGGLLEGVADFVASCLLWCDTNAAFLFDHKNPSMFFVLHCSCPHTETLQTESQGAGHIRYNLVLPILCSFPYSV